MVRLAQGIKQFNKTDFAIGAHSHKGFVCVEEELCVDMIALNNTILIQI